MSRGVTRELTITYNELDLGGSSEKYRITNFLRIRQEPEVGQAEFDVIVVGESQAAFAANCREFEEQMSEPWNDLTIKQGTSMLLEISQSSNTGLNPVVTVQKVGVSSDTGRTRQYHVVATWGRPANYPNAESAGLREYEVMVLFSPARRRTVSIQGVYTAVTDNNARAQYEAKVEAFATAVLTAIDSTATFELVEETAQHDTNNKLLDFERTYEEVIFSQGSSGVANASIVNQTLDISVGRIAAEAHPDFTAEALTDIRIDYSAWFDKDQVSPSLANLKSQYTNLKDWLVSQAEAVFEGATALALIESTPIYDPVENRIRITMRLRGAQYGGYLEARFVVEDNVEYGVASIHGWTGKPFSKHVYDAEANIVRSIRMTMVKAGKLGQADAISEFQSFAGQESTVASPGGGGSGNVEDPPDPSPLPPAGRWYTLSRRAAADPYRIGLAGNTIDLTRLTAEANRFWVEKIDSTATTGGGGGGAAVTP